MDRPEFFEQLYNQKRSETFEKELKAYEAYKKRLKICDCIIACAFIVLFLVIFLYGIDKEVAIKDRMESGKATGCIFESNCK